MSYVYEAISAMSGTEQFVDLAVCGSSVGCISVTYADGRGFDSYVRQHYFVEIGHELISTTILPHFHKSSNKVNVMKPVSYSDKM